MKVENWKDHPNYPVIQVSDQGRVYRKPRTVHRGIDTYILDGRIAALNTGSKAGYLKVPIRMGGKYHHAWVHRLVLETFAGPCPDGMECRHLNGNPKDNRLENLAWGTPSENSADTKAHGYAPSRKDACKRGHPFTPDNTYRPPARPNDRHCKECQRARNREARR